MPDQETWPPPPDIPDPLAAHDDFLTNLLRAPVTKPPVSRLGMVRILHRITGLERRQCWMVVNDYCDRRAIFPQMRGLKLWLHLLPSLAQFGVFMVLFIGQIVLRRELAGAHTRTVRLLILQEYIKWDVILLCPFMVAVAASIVTVLGASKRARREAEEAREKVSQ